MEKAELMRKHECDTCVVTCIDFRFQPYLDKWLKENLEPGSYDRISMAGGIKNLDQVMDQISISHRLHHIKRAILINHEDCGAYGEEGNPERHAQDLKEIEGKINSQFPDLEVSLYYLLLNGTFEPIS